MTFRPADFSCTDTNLDDPVVVSIQLGDLIVRKVLLDPGSNADVLFFTTFEKMKLSTNILQPSVGDLVGFSGERVPVLGSVWLQTTLGTSVKDEEREKLVHFLRENTNLFAWTSGDMPGIDPSIITHKLVISPAAQPVSQKKRNLGTEKRLASMAEAKKLIDANFIREISFMDAYSGYNQILMHPSDQEKTTFITEYGATYQRLMNKVFDRQIGWNIKVYVDDMVAKT
ncbi:uncharacterized protein [Arachis hypogaea]|uniref:uncharacterized protein n=1 Tax=Arachis hypogaea TaxID=3818 RepID=UPI003B21344D